MRTRMNKNKTKKYPVLTYLCLTLLLCVMITGFTFSRYTGTQSGSIESAVSRFACSYDITDVSANSFINSDYYIKDEKGDNTGKINALRTVTYTVRNYEKENAGSPCDVALKTVLRIAGPYEFISNLCWQLERVDGNNYTVVTPQIVMSDIIANASSKSWNTCESAVENTADVKLKSESYDARYYGGGTKITVNGGINPPTDLNNLPAGYSETVTCEWYSSDKPDASQGGEFALSVYVLDSSYSLTYLRAETITVADGGNTEVLPGKATSPMFIDVQENALYCTLDIYLPDEMDLSAGKAAEKSFIMSFAIVNKIASINSAFTHYYDNGVFNNNAAGYHYDMDVAVRNSSGVAAKDADGKLITSPVRVKRSGSKYSYFKLTADSSLAVTETEFTAFSEDNRYVIDGDNYYAIEDLNNFLRSAQAAAEGKANDYTIGSCTDKSYDVSFRAKFIQTSENGGSE